MSHSRTDSGKPGQHSASPEADSTASAVIRWAIALAVLALAFLPLFSWLPVSGEFSRFTGSGAARHDWYRNYVDGWLSGTVIVLGVGVVLAILSDRIPGLWREGWLARPLAAHARRRRTGIILGAATGVVYLLVSWALYDFRPLLIDEITQLLQAQILAGGSLSVPTDPNPEFFSSMLMIDDAGRHYSQLPPGSAVPLAFGVLLGVPWLIAPLCGAITVVAFHDLMTSIEERPGVIVGATLLVAFAPFAVFFGGSYLNHVPTLMLLVIGCAALARAVTGRNVGWGNALIVGLAFGAAATIRMVEGVAFALPAGIWMLALTVRRRLPVASLLAAGAGIVIPLALMMVAHLATTGSALRFGYEVQWGAEHGLGFHSTAPWGYPHTPMRGLGLTNLYFLRLNQRLFELPIPSLLAGVAAFGLSRRVGSFDRYLLVAAGLLIGLYFAYWFDGYWELGPRFYHALIPVFAIWTARFPSALRSRTGGGMPYRAAIYGGITALVMAVLITVPLRAAHYGTMMASLRWDAEKGAREAGVRDALVFVREPWGSQLLVRMWELGVPRRDSEHFYNNIDLCVLEERVLALESAGVRDSAAIERIQPLLADTAHLQYSPYFTATRDRYLPGKEYGPRCAQRVREDLAGTTHLPPQLLARDGNIYARDLHERNVELLQRYPDRPVYLLRPDGLEAGRAHRFLPLSRDSLLATYAQGVQGGDTPLPPQPPARGVANGINPPPR